MEEIFNFLSLKKRVIEVSNIFNFGNLKMSTVTFSDNETCSDRSPEAEYHSNSAEDDICSPLLSQKVATLLYSIHLNNAKLKLNLKLILK